MLLFTPQFLGSCWLHIHKPLFLLTSLILRLFFFFFVINKQLSTGLWITSSVAMVDIAGAMAKFINMETSFHDS